MKFKRKIEIKLADWGRRVDRKPLILRGARQVGKSTTVRLFGQTYTTYLELNLEKKDDKAFFETYNDVNKLLEVLFFEKGMDFTPNQTLLFIDEIQECPQAIQLLRYFYEERPDIRVIAVGSLLEFAIKRVSSFPVGRVEQMVLHPLDFSEFLEAVGEDKALTYLNTIPFPDLAYNKIEGLFHRYMMLGGMPHVVAQYVEDNQTFVRGNLDRIYDSIWQGYKDDVEKYASTDKEMRVLRHVISSAPFIQDRISFPRFGNSDYRSNDVHEAFDALGMARVLKILRPTTNVEPPLMPDLKRKPRMQFLDTGLMNFAAGIQAELLGVQDFASFYKGYVVNHIVNQEIMAQSDQVGYNLHFWVRENAKANAEVDICLKHKGLLLPIEVKSGASGRLRSLHQFMNRAPHKYAIRLLANTISQEQTKTIAGKEFELLNLPYFLGCKLDEYMEWFCKE